MSDETKTKNSRYTAIFDPPIYVPRVFAGIHKQPCPVRYTLLKVKDDSTINKIAIVVFQESANFATTFYTNADEGRDLLMNQILREAVPGIAIEFVKVIFLSVTESGVGAADEFDLLYDPQTLDKYGVPVKKDWKQKSFNLRDLVIGQVPFYTDYMNRRRPLQRDEVEEILSALGRKEAIVR